MADDRRRREIDDQVYETFSGMKVIDLFEGVMQYIIEYGGDAPGNSGTSLVYLCREDCLDGLLASVSAICDALRGPAARGEMKGKA